MVAVAYRAAVMSMSRVKIDIPKKFEVPATVGTISGHTRKLVTVAAYIPPGYTARRRKECMDHIAGTIMELKRRYREPYLVVSGDFNQWDVLVHLEDFPDLSEVPVGPTRGNSRIDRVFYKLWRPGCSEGHYRPLGC